MVAKLDAKVPNSNISTRALQVTRNARHPASPEYSGLFAELVYGLDASGRVVHISEVSRGLLCNCKCPACGTPLVAHKGNQIAHHFKHSAGQSCPSAPETALHQLAKQVIEHEKKLLIPDRVATHENLKKRVGNAKVVEFDEVYLERRDECGLVPDVTAFAKGRKLFIEIAVTHHCDQDKRERLAAQDTATLEIDLSALSRAASTDEIKDAVLHSFPRRWVFHKRIETEQERLKRDADDKKRADKERYKSQLQIYQQEYESGVEHARQKPYTHELSLEVLNAGFTNDCVGIEIAGFGCFRWHPRDWQVHILEDLLVPAALSGHPIFPPDALKSLKAKNAIREKFKYIQPSVEKDLIKKIPSFLSPYGAITEYLENLRRRGLVYKFRSEYRIPDKVSKSILLARDDAARRMALLKETRERVQKILQILPESETSGITADMWLETLLDDYALSAREMIERADPRTQEILGSLSRIERMLFSGGAIIAETLQLPIETALEREVSKRAADEKVRNEKATQREQEQGEERFQRLLDEATQSLLDADSWVGTPIEMLDGRTPELAARSDQNGLQLALRQLRTEVNQRRIDTAKEEKAQSCKEKLLTKAIEMLGPEKAELFISAAHPRIQNKRPKEYCIDDRTLGDCLRLLEIPKGQRRSNLR